MLNEMKSASGGLNEMQSVPSVKSASGGKRLTLFLAVCFYSTTLFSQNITNTLGTGGMFKIKDASTDYLTLAQGTGQVNILRGLRLELTGNNTTTGVIFKGVNRFIHDFKPPNAIGYNTFIGINSGSFTMSYVGGTDASYNTGVGYISLTNITRGTYNTAIGSGSLYFNTTGSYNSAAGSDALLNNTSGFYNTASGQSSLYSNTIGYYNTASGYQSLYSNTEGIHNTALGYRSLQYNITSSYNTALGNQSLQNNTGGYDNTATGHNSLQTNTTGNDNTASGFNSLLLNTTGSWNTALGSGSLYWNSIGLYNTASGYHSLYQNSGGYDNTASGTYSLENNTEGFNNTAVGSRTGSTISTGNNLTCLGYDAEPTTGFATDQITLGNGGITSLRCNVTNITSLSDARDKNNIKDLNLGIDFLMKIKARQFNWDKREWYDDNKSDESKMKEEPTAGFIAQELDEAQTTEKAEWLNLVLKDNPKKLEATPGNLLPIMVKAIQDLKKENDELTDRLIKFEQMQNMLVAEIEKLKTNNNETTKVSLGEK